MKRWTVLVIGAGAAALFACTSGSTLDTTGDGGTSDGGGSDGGGGSTTIDVKDLDNSCATANDCVAVYTGDACAICQCANGVIAKKTQTAYDAKVKAAQSSCGPRPAIACAADCAQLQFSCGPAGKCVVGIISDGG